MQMVGILVSGFLMVAVPPSAQFIGVYADAQGTECAIQADNAPTTISVYVVAWSYPSNSLAGVLLLGRLPACFSGAVYMGEENMWQLAIGNTQDGLALIAESCASAPAVVSRIDVLVSTPPTNDECCQFAVEPDPSAASGEIEILTCSGSIVYARGRPGFVNGPSPPLFAGPPSPAPGATDVALDARLDWDAENCSCALGVYYAHVYFGTTPDPPLVTQMDQVPLAGPYDPGVLQPGTTYYWKLVLVDSDVPSGTTTPVWSFTTTTSVAVQQTTWGRLKALMSE